MKNLSNGYCHFQIRAGNIQRKDGLEMSRGMGRSFGGHKSAAKRAMISAVSGVSTKAPKLQSVNNYKRKAKHEMYKGL